MKFKTYCILSTLSLIVLGISYFFEIVPLPSQIPMNIITSKENSLVSKFILWIFFAMPVVIYIFYAIFDYVLNKRGHIRENKNEERLMWFSLLIFFIYLTVTFAETFRRMNVSIIEVKFFINAMMIGFVVLSIIIGNYLPSIRYNTNNGLKFSWTLKNEEVWDRTHQMAGKYVVAGGLFSILFMVMFGEILPLVVTTVLPLVMLLLTFMVMPAIYSYKLYNKITN